MLRHLREPGGHARGCWAVDLVLGRVMTESEWPVCNDPRRMLGTLTGKASRRKLLLFRVACIRAAWDRLGDDRSRRAVAWPS